MSIGKLLVAATIAIVTQGCCSSEKCATAPVSAPPPTPAPPPAPVVRLTPPQPAQPSGVFHIEVAKDGALTIEGAHVASPRELAERARASARANPDLLVIIAADPDTPFSHVLTAHDVAKQSGFSRVTISQGKASSPASSSTAPSQRPVPTLRAGDSWKCSISHHVDRLEEKSVFVAIHVGPDGNPQTVDVLDDPGFGLGDAARICALNQTFDPALDANGKPTAGVKKLRLRFQRR